MKERQGKRVTQTVSCIIPQACERGRDREEFPGCHGEREGSLCRWEMEGGDRRQESGETGGGTHTGTAEGTHTNAEKDMNQVLLLCKHITYYASQLHTV